MSADYAVGSAMNPPNIGSPALQLRMDTPGTQTTANQQLDAQMADSYGNHRVTLEGGAPTYYATSNFSCDSTATDIAQIAGNAATVVQVLEVRVCTLATTAIAGLVNLIRRSAANTAGTAVAASSGKADSRNATPGSIPVHYTVHPSALGATAGTIRTVQILQNVVGSTVLPAEYVFDLRPKVGEQALRLNGIAEFLSVNAAAALGGSGNVWAITWIYKLLPLTA